MVKKRKLEATGADRSELRALLAAAKQDYWDDGPRLAVADWLEENGGEADRARAEVIRLQLDTANGGPDWRLSVERLRAKNVREWVGPHRDFFARNLPECDRGLLRAEVAASAWQNPGPSDEAWDWVESARVKALPARDVPALLTSPRLSTVTRLEFDGNPLEGSALRAVASGCGKLRALSLHTHAALLPDFGRLLPPGMDELSITSWYLGARDWPALLGCAGTASLRSLSLGISSLTDVDAKSFAKRPDLRWLSLERTHLTATGLASLAVLPLRRLAIDEAAFGIDGLERLSDSACRESLEELFLDSCGEPAKWEGTLSPGRPWPRLRRLMLCGSHLSHESLKVLGRAGLLSVSALDLSRNAFGPKGVESLAECDTAPRALWLGGCALGDAGVECLATWPGLAGTRFLGLDYNGIGNKGLRALAASPHLGALEALALHGNNAAITPGLISLLRSPIGARLRWLSLQGVLARSATARALLTHAPLSFRELRLGSYLVGALGTKGLATLRARLPECAIG